MPRLLLLLAPLSLLPIASPAVADDSTSPVDFNRDVRPILSDVCFQCHGPDAKERKADLRLDDRDSLFGDRGGYRVVVPKKPGSSEIIERLTTDDPELRMPPAGFAKQLTPAQVDVIRRWIAEGAEWQGHWAYVPPIAPTPPLVRDVHDFVRNDIDRFVYLGLLRNDLDPSPEADRVTLIRRLSFDLRGLPPTVEEVDAFLADESDDAYETLVDQFLADERFGERMAIHWLDLVRYADSTGYHSDKPRNVWLYRDWVIKSFNENLPYDRFTIEQLAGDLLPEPSRWQQIASGYNRLLQTTDEGGAQAKEYTAKYAADRVRNVSTVWLGSTLGCSECHDHKFDPFTTVDFYAFEAFFADVQETAVGRQGEMSLPTAEQRAEIARLEAQRAELQAVLDEQTPGLDAELAKWETSTMLEPTWSVEATARHESKGGAKFETLEGGSLLAKGPNPAKDEQSLAITRVREGITGVRLEVLPHDSLPGKGPGRAANGNFVLNEIEFSLAGKPVKVAHASATHSQKDYEIAKAVDGNLGTGWAILPNAGQATEAVFEFAEDVAITLAVPLEIRTRYEYGTSHVIGHARFSVTTAERPVRAGGEGRPEEITRILKTDRNDRSDEQRTKLATWFRTIAPSLAPVRKQVAEIEAKKAAIEKAAPTSLVTTAVNPRTIRVLPRGNWLDDSGPVVEPALPEFLGELEAAGRSSRLDLARWIASKENPLTARVLVNRLWAISFGRGIVTTLDDFGSQGRWPTHPELLDWLALDFVEHGWDVKRSLKQIVMSGTYRQSSVADDELRGIDPYNRWLARQGRWRLDAEVVRDNALAVSGLLNPTIGGPSVKPYQPAGYWKHLNFPKRTWQHDANDSQYRRGLYVHWQRSFLHPSLLAFDAPSREECTVERPRSNNPLQALVLLNDPTYVEASRAFAERIIAKGGDTDEERLRFAVRHCVSREPTDEELRILTDLLEKHRREYGENPANADELLAIGLSPIADQPDHATLAAWTSIARVLLNLHETITRG